MYLQPKAKRNSSQGWKAVTSCNILVHGPVRNRFTDIFGEKQQNIWKCTLSHHCLHKIAPKDGCTKCWSFCQNLTSKSESILLKSVNFWSYFFIIAWLQPHCVYPQHSLKGDCNQSPHPEWGWHTSDVSVSWAVCLTVHNHAARRAVTAWSLPYKTGEVFKISLLSIKIFTRRFNSFC